MASNILPGPGHPLYGLRWARKQAREHLKAPSAPKAGAEYLWSTDGLDELLQALTEDYYGDERDGPGRVE